MANFITAIFYIYFTTILSWNSNLFYEKFSRHGQGEHNARLDRSEKEPEQTLDYINISDILKRHYSLSFDWR